MSILIKGMKMPRNCFECHLHSAWICILSNEKILSKDTGVDIEKKPNWCPLVEIPTPHGRLIDADKLSNQKYENIWTNRLIIDADDLDDALTVIEAEGSEE